MTEEKKQKPTKKWIEDQMNYHMKIIISNQGSLDLLKAMLENGVYVEETDGSSN